MRNVLKALLIVASVLLAYMCYRSVMNPIEFAEQKAVRDAVVIEKLVNIRKAQIAYCEANGKYAGKMQNLIDFVNTGVIPKVAKKGELTDEQMKAGLTEEIAIALLPEDAAKYGIANYDSVGASMKSLPRKPVPRMMMTPPKHRTMRIIIVPRNSLTGCART